MGRKLKKVSKEKAEWIGRQIAIFSLFQETGLALQDQGNKISKLGTLGSLGLTMIDDEIKRVEFETKRFRKIVARLKVED